MTAVTAVDPRFRVISIKHKKPPHCEAALVISGDMYLDERFVTLL